LTGRTLPLDEMRRHDPKQALFGVAFEPSKAGISVHRDRIRSVLGETILETESRELYASPNGDRWSFIREAQSGQPFVLHEANLPAGGARSLINVGEFLALGSGPEQQELLRLIGTLIETQRS
jgi:hypothetical protein